MHITDCETIDDFNNELKTIRGFLDSRSGENKTVDPELSKQQIELRDKLDGIIL